MIAGLHGKSMFSFVRNSQTVFQSSFYHFSFTVMNETSCCSTTSPVFGVASVQILAILICVLPTVLKFFFKYVLYDSYVLDIRYVQCSENF